MSTYFSPEIDKYFAAWILRETWHTTHALDEGRFHGFVWALDSHEYAERLDEVMLREKIVYAVTENHSFDRQLAEEIAEQRVRSAREILDFLNNTRQYPIPDVERWDPPLK